MKKFVSLLVLAALCCDMAVRDAQAIPSESAIHTGLSIACAFEKEAIPAEAIVSPRYSTLREAFLIRVQAGAWLALTGLLLAQGAHAQKPATTNSQTQSKSKAPAAAKITPAITLQQLLQHLKESHDNFQHFQEMLPGLIGSIMTSSPLPDDLRKRQDAAERITEIMALSTLADPAEASMPPAAHMESLSTAWKDLHDKMEALKKAREAVTAAKAALSPKTRDAASLKSKMDEAETSTDELLKTVDSYLTSHALTPGAAPKNIFASRFYQVWAIYTGEGKGTILIFTDQEKLSLSGGIQLGLGMIGNQYDILTLEAQPLLSEFTPVPNLPPFDSMETLNAYRNGKEFNLADLVEKIYGPGAARAWAGSGTQGVKETASPAPSVVPPVPTAETEAAKRLAVWFGETDEMNRWFTQQGYSGKNPLFFNIMATVMEVMAKTAGLRPTVAYSFREVYLLESFHTTQELLSHFPSVADQEKLLSRLRALAADPDKIAKQYGSAELQAGETKPQFLARLIREEIGSPANSAAPAAPPTPQQGLVRRSDFGGARVIVQKLPDLVTAAEKNPHLDDLQHLSGFSPEDQRKVFLAVLALGGSSLEQSAVQVQLGNLPKVLKLLSDASATDPEAAELKKTLEPYSVPAWSASEPRFIYNSHDRVLEIRFDMDTDQFRINNYATDQAGVRRTEYVIKIDADHALQVSQKHVTYPEKTADDAYKQHSQEKLIASVLPHAAGGMPLAMLLTFGLPGWLSWISMGIAAITFSGHAKFSDVLADLGRLSRLVSDPAPAYSIHMAHRYAEVFENKDLVRKFDVPQKPTEFYAIAKLMIFPSDVLLQNLMNEPYGSVEYRLTVKALSFNYNLLAFEDIERVSVGLRKSDDLKALDLSDVLDALEYQGVFLHGVGDGQSPHVNRRTSNFRYIAMHELLAEEVRELHVEFPGEILAVEDKAVSSGKTTLDWILDLRRRGIHYVSVRASDLVTSFEIVDGLSQDYRFVFIVKGNERGEQQVQLIQAMPVRRGQPWIRWTLASYFPHLLWLLRPLIRRIGGVQTGEASFPAGNLEAIEKRYSDIRAGIRQEPTVRVRPVSLFDAAVRQFAADFPHLLRLANADALRPTLEPHTPKHMILIRALLHREVSLFSDASIRAAFIENGKDLAQRGLLVSMIVGLSPELPYAERVDTYRREGDELVRIPQWSRGYPEHPRWDRIPLYPMHTQDSGPLIDHHRKDHWFGWHIPGNSSVEKTMQASA